MGSGSSVLGFGAGFGAGSSLSGLGVVRGFVGGIARFGAPGIRGGFVGIGAGGASTAASIDVVVFSVARLSSWWRELLVLPLVSPNLAE